MKNKQTKEAKNQAKYKERKSAKAESLLDLQESELMNLIISNLLRSISTISLGKPFKALVPRPYSGHHRTNMVVLNSSCCLLFLVERSLWLLIIIHRF